MTPKLKKIIIIVLVVGLSILAYFIFFDGSSNKNNELIVGTDSLAQRRSINETKMLGQQITQTLIKIESIKLDRSIFGNQLFLSLDDKSRSINPEPVGRRNPFAPLSDKSVNYSVSQDSNNRQNDLQDNGGGFFAEPDNTQATSSEQLDPEPQSQVTPQPARQNSPASDPDTNPGFGDLFGDDFDF